MQSLLKNNYWTRMDLYSAIDDVTVEQLAEFARCLRSRLYVRALMQGNLSKEQARDIMENMKNILNYKPLLPNTWPEVRKIRNNFILKSILSVDFL
jgi:secreted Zn-dependent insulinase-like peptidase